MSQAEMEAAELTSDIESIESEFAELTEAFGDLGLDAPGQQESSGELAELDAAVAGTEFDLPVSSDGEANSILEIADDLSLDSMEEGLGSIFRKIGKGVRNIFKGKARKIIRKIVRLVRKYSRLKACVPAVAVAVAAFKAGKYGTAIRSGWAALKCIRKHI